MPNKAFCSFVLASKSKNPVYWKCYYKYLSRRQNMLEIRHNQIRKSIPVRQKTLKTFKDLSLFLFRPVININLEFVSWKYSVWSFEFEISSWNFLSQHSSNPTGYRWFKSKVGDLTPELPKKMFWKRQIALPNLTTWPTDLVCKYLSHWTINKQGFRNYIKNLSINRSISGNQPMKSFILDGRK